MLQGCSKGVQGRFWRCAAGMGCTSLVFLSRLGKNYRFLAEQFLLLYL